jgi:hypothetical protein
MPSGAPQCHPPADTPPLGCARARLARGGRPRRSVVQLGQAAQDGIGPLGGPRGESLEQLPVIGCLGVLAFLTLGEFDLKEITLARAVIGWSTTTKRAPNEA